MIQRPSASLAIILALLFAACAALPLLPAGIAGPYEIKFMTRVLILAIMVISLDLLIGITGLVSFGHAAYFGLGAYAVYLITPKFAAANVLLAVGAAVALSTIAAIIIGYFVVRTHGFYFIMVTMAVGEMLFALFHDTQIAGGSDGATINFKPVLEIGSLKLLNLSHRATLYYISLAGLVLTYLGCLWLVRTRFGRVLQSIRWNETRMQALGFDTFRYKLAIYVIAGAIAGFAGALFASIDGFVPPQLLGWRESGLAIMMVVLGGVGTLHGALLGTFAYSIIEEVLKDSHIVGRFIADHWAIPMGLILIAIVLAAPRGIAGWLPSGKRRPVHGDRTGTADAAEDRPPAKPLSVSGLSKTFGGLVAVDNVELTFAPNRVHAIIGPNGAGKTTFTNVLTGLMAPSGGHIRLDREDITALPAHRKAHAGLGRSFQRTNIIAAFTVEENCLISAQARAPGLTAKAAPNERQAIESALSATGLADRRERLAGELSHGEQRQLEIAMLIASGARILVLDEPLAGTGPEETQRVTALLRELARNHTVILIEHDMDAVFSVADTISVLVNGQLIATGTPAEIRSNAEVREAYLGSFEPQAGPS